ncbi:hypothetical protein DP939_07215 [Spongiactinospora rosea]|uniref:Uncharacterized protein n=1 Tax=Spongiactinospora rosea TaxID=2248750 RepID=A0A366M537_9ACTN|nr:hypothetical protein DP939_07215 [Spongiactinospora rosea]
MVLSHTAAVARARNSRSSLSGRWSRSSSVSWSFQRIVHTARVVWKFGDRTARRMRARLYSSAANRSRASKVPSTHASARPRPSTSLAATRSRWSGMALPRSR